MKMNRNFLQDTNKVGLTIHFTVTSITVMLLFLLFLPNGIAQPVYQWKNVEIGGGSYVTGITFHPKEEGLVYIKTDIGGSYRWNEAEMRWIPLTDHISIDQADNYFGQVVKVDPNNPDIVYITLRDGTLLKSTDRGDKWIELKMDVPVMGGAHNDILAINPFNPDVIIYFTQDFELIKSINGGVTWNSRGKIIATQSELRDIRIMFDPLVRDRVIANSFEEGIYESLDGGDTWKLLEGSPKGVLRMALSQDGILYTAGRIAPKVAKMNRDGIWENITPQKYDIETAQVRSTRRALEGFNFCGIDVNPLNSEHIVISLDYQTPNKILQSMDGGTSWHEVMPVLKHTVPWWPIEWWGGGVAEVKFDPHIPGQVWFVDFKGIWRTEDITATPSIWTNLLDGQEEIVITDLIAPPPAPSSSGYMLMSIAADVDGFVHYDLDTYPEKKLGPPTYQYTVSMDYCASDPSYVVRVGESWAVNSMGNFIVPGVDPFPFGGSISSDEGKTWEAFGSLPVTKGVISRVAMSATDPNIILAITGYDEGAVYRTADGGNSWQEIKTLPDKRIAGIGYRDNRKFLVADRVNGDKFYYFDGEKFLRSTDGGQSFSPTAASLPVVDASVRSRWPITNIKAVTGMEGEVWIGLNEEGLFRSSDSGSSFSRIRNVERVILYAFGKPLEGMTNPVLYLYGTVGGKTGVFRSLDFGKRWRDISPKNNVGLGANPRIMEASKSHAGLVFIGTFGRGIYYGVPENFPILR